MKIFKLVLSNFFFSVFQKVSHLFWSAELSCKQNHATSKLSICAFAKLSFRGVDSVISLARKQKHSRLEIHRFYRSKELKQFGLMDEFYLQFWTKWIELSTVIITVLRLNAGIFYKNTKSQGLFSMENIAKWR